MTNLNKIIIVNYWVKQIVRLILYKSIQFIRDMNAERVTIDKANVKPNVICVRNPGFLSLSDESFQSRFRCDSFSFT